MVRNPGLNLRSFRLFSFLSLHALEVSFCDWTHQAKRQVRNYFFKLPKVGQPLVATLAKVIVPRSYFSNLVEQFFPLLFQPLRGAPYNFV